MLPFWSYNYFLVSCKVILHSMRLLSCLLLSCLDSYRSSNRKCSSMWQCSTQRPGLLAANRTVADSLASSSTVSRQSPADSYRVSCMTSTWWMDDCWQQGCRYNSSCSKAIRQSQYYIHYFSKDKGHIYTQVGKQHSSMRDCLKPLCYY